MSSFLFHTLTFFSLLLFLFKHFSTYFCSFLSIFQLTFVPFWAVFIVILVPFWAVFIVIFVTFWANFTVLLSRIFDIQENVQDYDQLLYQYVQGIIRFCNKLKQIHSLKWNKTLQIGTKGTFALKCWTIST